MGEKLKYLNFFQLLKYKLWKSAVVGAYISNDYGVNFIDEKFKIINSIAF